MVNTPEFMKTIAMTSRIRLARNLSGFPFPSKMTKQHALEILYLVERALRKIDPGEYRHFSIDKLSHSEASSLQEKYIISEALSKRLNGGGVFVSKDEAVSIMVNEEDHLREQYILKGFDLYRAYERLSAIDDGLSTVLDFAFDERLGYLTACPSNLGTGMRASVMLFLPGLTWTGELKEEIRSWKAQGMTVRGAFGEGSIAEGYQYQVSNERTLGLSEKEILELVTEFTMVLCDREIVARERLLEEAETETRDRVLRAYGTLCNCALLDLPEFLNKIAEVRVGIALGFLKVTNEKKFEEFLDDMRPATFCLNHMLEGENERFYDEVRAETVGRMLPNLVYAVRRGE
ncbi:MAG: ATP--guanido phosphotransferase [Clostridia bacterium]|nr:ATP--guanido phosphotransferase [Clostridia bacterium]